MLDGVARHETVVRALAVLANMEHRGAAGADADTGDGAGILVQLPDAFLRASPTSTCPPPAATGSRVCFLPQLGGRRRELEQLLERDVAAEGQRCSAGATSRCRERAAGRHAQLFAPAIRQLFVGAADELEATARVRAQALRDPPRRRARRRPGARDPELLLADARLQGNARRRRSSRRYFPDLARRADRERARARALALLDEHVPELGARASVPPDRAQRRDQHAARQRELDPRARVAARLGALRRRPRASCCR